MTSNVLKKLASAVAMTCAVGIAHAAEPAAPKTNVLLILADDVGVEAFGTYGGTSYKTPNIDALARRGVQFTNAHTYPLCTPTRAALLTGQHNFRNYQAFGWLDPAETTFAEVLRSNGYATAIAGKWQLSNPAPGMKVRPRPGQSSPDVKPDTIRDGYGFDQYNLWQLNIIGSRYNDPTYERNGQLFKDVKGEYGPDVSVKFLREFMRTSHAAGKPFLAYYAMELPHDPWQSTPDSAEPHTGKSAPRYFKDNIEYLDKLVGQLVAEVDDLKLRDNTLIVFTSDNGTAKLITSETASGPVTGRKGAAVDAGTHVPLILSLPGKIEPGTRSERLAFVTDLFPTFLNVAAVTPPKDLLLDGRALLPGPGPDRPAEPRETIYMKYDAKGRNTPTAEWARTARYKLHADGKLFDLSQAPTEQPEAAIPADKASPEAQSARQQLQQVLDHYAAQQQKAPG